MLEGNNVKMGTAEALVNRLTIDNAGFIFSVFPITSTSEPNFLLQYLITFPAHTPPNKLLELLLSRCAFGYPPNSVILVKV